MPEELQQILTMRELLNYAKHIHRIRNEDATLRFLRHAQKIYEDEVARVKADYAQTTERRQSPKVIRIEDMAQLGAFLKQL